MCGPEGTETSYACHEDYIGGDSVHTAAAVGGFHAIVHMWIREKWTRCLPACMEARRSGAELCKNSRRSLLFMAVRRNRDTEGQKLDAREGELGNDQTSVHESEGREMVMQHLARAFLQHE